MKKKTKSVIILTLILIICSTLGCNASNTNTVNKDTTTITAEASENDFGFERIYTNHSYSIYIYREISTDVMYCSYYGGAGGLTVMMDPQTGGPLTYENWKTNYKSK